MKILLVIPPNNLQERYGKLKSVGTMYPSLGLGSIASIAEQYSYEVKIIDCEMFKCSYDDLEKIIIDYQPDLIGMQVFCNTINRAIEIAKNVKTRIDKNIKVVLGGIQATLYSGEYIKNPYIDFIVRGEGENIFKNLLSNLKSNKKDFSNIKGISWKDKDNNIIENYPEDLIQNLDILPFPAWHLFDMPQYHTSAQLRGKRTYHIVTSRGCPNGCAYCSCHKSFGKTHRFFSSEYVIDMIKHLINKYNMDSLHFYDDTFTSNRDRIIELCNKMISNGLKIPWACFTRVDCVDSELLSIMKKSGCYQIFYGVEAANQRLLNLIKKNITIAQVKNAFKLTKEHGIETLASFILGLPTETNEDAKKTLDLAIDIDADYVHWELYSPHPGTNLFNYALETGRLTTTDWNKFTTWSDKPLYIPANRTEEELVNIKKWVYRKYYLRPLYILKMIKILSKLPLTNIIKLFIGGIRVFFDPKSLLKKIIKSV